MKTYHSLGRAFVLMCSAAIVVSCSEKQQDPTEVRSAENLKLALYDLSKLPASAFELPEQLPQATVAAMMLPGIELITNGDFSGGFAGWTTNDAGNGNWILNNGSPVDGFFVVPAPPSAPVAAMSRQSGPGRHILYQDVLLPAQLCGPLQISFGLFLGNRSFSYASPNHFNFNIFGNQQVRADIVDPAAPLDAYGSLQTLYQTNPGDLLIDGYKTVSGAFAGTGGTTVRIRFVEVDNQGQLHAGVDNVSVTAVPDLAAPTIGLNVSPATLWPPNHAMVKVASGVTATDDCAANPTVTITVTSNEPINGPGDGNTEPDWQVVSNVDGTFDVYVRAERSGKGTGRVYTISVTATDSFGNSSSASGTVTVPHSQKK